MHIRRWTACFAIAALALALASAESESAAVASGKPKVAVRTITKVRNGYITKISYPDGTVVKAYSDVPMHEATSAALVDTGQSSGAVTAEHSVSGELVPDWTISKKALNSGATNSTLSNYDTLLVLGADPRDIAMFTDNAPVYTGSASGINTSSAIAAVTPSLSQRIGHRCVDVDFDGTHGHLYGCDNQYKVWVNPNNSLDWELQNDTQASASMHDSALFNPDELTGLKFGIHYGPNNQIEFWSPTQTKPVGLCGSTTTSSTVKGFTVSSTMTECPEAWGLYYIGPQNFTTKWDGQGSGPSDGSRATHSDSSDYCPPDATAAMTIPWTVWWA